MAYKVGKCQGVMEQIRASADLATLAGIRQIYIDALKQTMIHLETRPLEWGDPEYRTNYAGGVVCHGIVEPLIVRYAVYETDQVVLIIEIKLLPESLQ